MQKKLLLPFLLLCASSSLVAQTSTPEVLATDITIKRYVDAPFESVKLSHNPVDGKIYIISQNGAINRIDVSFGTLTSLTEVQNTSDHGLSDIQGMDISSDGRMFIVGNHKDNQGPDATYTNVATIKRASITDGDWTWETVATTDPWPISNTDFDHIMNEIVISPDDKMLYINSGSRTDHGEEQAVWGDGLPEEGVYPGLRETPLTAKILSVPADTTDAILKNDQAYLETNGFIYAEGTRNSFGMSFDGNGNLFSADNAGERDDPGEFNWLQKGKHYGFPWRIGGNDTPMQFPGYDPADDSLYNAVGRDDLFYDDPDYPARPDSIEFVEPILNYGPDAVNYVDYATGEIMNAFEQDTAISSFTGHRSSLGLSFDKDSLFRGDYKGDGFLMAFTGGNDGAFLLKTMEDDGEDLVHIELTKSGDTYTMHSKTLVKGFFNPIDSEIIGDKLYVMEFRNGWLNNRNTTSIWEVDFSSPTVSNENESDVASAFKLNQNYPNPFNPSTTISYELSAPAMVELQVVDAMGRTVSNLVNQPMSAGSYTQSFDASNLASGMYFYSLRADGVLIATKKMLLMK